MKLKFHIHNYIYTQKRMDYMKMVQVKRLLVIEVMVNMNNLYNDVFLTIIIFFLPCYSRCFFNADFSHPFSFESIAITSNSPV